MSENVRYSVNSLRDRVARGIASKEEVQALCDHAEHGELCSCAAESAPAPELHEISYTENRNGWTYIKCACGWTTGPFYNTDYAKDSFEIHAARPVPPAPEAEGMEQRRNPHPDLLKQRENARNWMNSIGYGYLATDAVVEAVAAFARAEVVRALEAAAGLCDEQCKAEHMLGQPYGETICDMLAAAIRKQIAEVKG